MPYTFNGIGTHYYGQSNKSSIQDTCKFCNRFGKLSSYDTRECFCLIFIPIIPLGKYRIQNDCPVCRKHLRIPFKTFYGQLDSAVEPLKRDVQTRPNDPDAHLSLAQAYLNFGMYAQAEQATREALMKVRDARLTLLQARLTVIRGDVEGSIPLFQQAISMNSGDADARLSLGRALYRLKRYDEAIRELNEVKRLDSSKTDADYLTAESYFALQRWSEAYQAYEQFLGRRPELAQDRDLLLKIKKCKQQLGYPLSDAESRVKKRWFGGSRGVSTSTTNWKRNGIILGVLVAALVIGFAAYGLWSQKNETLYLDSGIGRPVVVNLDGESITLNGHNPVERTVPPGTHKIVTTLDGKEVEKLNAEINERSLLDAIFNDRFFVYNISAAHIYSYETIGYATSAEGRTYDERLIPFKQFFAQKKTDYVFQMPPDTISIEGDRETRTAFNIAGDLDYNSFGMLRWGQGKAKEAEAGFRKAIELDSCSTGARRNLVDFLISSERDEDAVKDSRQWILDCPDSSVEAQRAYQDVLLDEGKRDQLIAEYHERVVLAPEVAANHYLYGRLLQDVSASVAEQQIALQLNPQFTWAHVSLANNFLTNEQYPDAFREMSAAVVAPDFDPGVTSYFAYAAIGAGEAKQAAEVLKRIPAIRLKTTDALEARWLVTLGSENWVDASKIVDQLIKSDPDSRRAWLMKTQMLRFRGEPEPLAKWLDSSRKRKSVAYDLQGILFERKIDAKQYADAADQLDHEISRWNGGAPPLYRLYAAAGLIIAGDRTRADAQLAAMKSELQANPDDEDMMRLYNLLAGALKGESTSESVLQQTRRTHFLMVKHAYFFLGARALAAGDRVGAERLFQQSARACLDLDFPLQAAQQITKE